MQTFLPVESFEESARLLDWRRLGKQRVEARQILRALEGDGGWSRHPATRMWEGHEAALRLYGNVVIREWVRRGYVNNMEILRSGGRIRMPPWLGSPDFHASHRSNLLRKDPGHYGALGWGEPTDLPYVWPVVG